MHASSASSAAPGRSSTPPCTGTHLNGLVRVGIGRDAADAAVASIFGAASRKHDRRLPARARSEVHRRAVGSSDDTRWNCRAPTATDLPSGPVQPENDPPVGDAIGARVRAALNRFAAGSAPAARGTRWGHRRNRMWTPTVPRADSSSSLFPTHSAHPQRMPSLKPSVVAENVRSTERTI